MLKRRVVALVGGLVILFVGVEYALWSGLALIAKLNLLKRPEDIAIDHHVYRKFGDFYTTFSWMGLCLAAAFCFTALVWEKRERSHLHNLALWVLLCLVLPLSVANFWAADLYTERSQQVVLDIILVILSLLTLSQLLRLPVATDSGRVIRGIAIFLLSLEGVFLPAIYAILWLLNAQLLLSLNDTKNLNPGLISGVSSVGALVVSVLNYRRGLAASQPAAASTGK